ncbi:hypothetical protein CDG81_05485 [Actinopolyspora erythraea]|uniref:Uncharacterized protein n=1 Tax=Actinopolyspora erythraea TaxID=414996 RepID=A0A099D1Z1_9ACTN|nr:hypothetical protein [Actinopolyspora erythraea]ASU77854.1 hypothetical protein CDG81_05485 [Actinopolyspora erythraea]KGI79842.1 hypothetical protein IL38_20480 [Actinopolyspora erythraea]
MSGYDARLWRGLDRALLILAVGTVALLIAAGGSSRRADSVLGLLTLAAAVLPVVVTVVRLPAHARAKLPELPRRRRLLTITAFLGACAAACVALWSLFNVVAPGTSAPLALAVPALALAGITTAGGRVLGRRNR